MINEKLKQEVQSLREDLISRYKDLHIHPEIGFNEKRTSMIIAQELKSYGLKVIEGIAITGVVGILDSGKPGKTIMIRADMDCLEILELADIDYKSRTEGLMHACGHDSHVTMLLGAAKVLAKNKDQFEGKIKFVFQPAEEGIPNSMKKFVRENGYYGEGGAGFLVKEGIMDDVSASIIMHVQPSLPSGKVLISRKNACASSDVFNLTIIGKGGHGAAPQNAIDPVPAMAEIISAIHMLPTREVSALETVVLSIGSVETPGTPWNAVAEKAVVIGGIRTFNQNIREHLNKRVKEIAENISKANRCTLKYSKTTGYMPCINDEEISKFIAEKTQELLGEENVIYTDEPAMTSEDCGIYLEKSPGIFFWLGVGKGNNEPPLHNPYMNVDLNSLEIGTLLHVNNAIELLNKINKEEA